MTSLVKAEKAWLKVRVLVNTAVVTARNAHAPVGNGSNTRPTENSAHPYQQRQQAVMQCALDCRNAMDDTEIAVFQTSGVFVLQMDVVRDKESWGISLPAMVVTKIESRDHAFSVTPAGTGTRNRSASPIATDAAKGTSLTPCTTAFKASSLRLRHVCLP